MQNPGGQGNLCHCGGVWSMTSGFVVCCVVSDKCRLGGGFIQEFRFSNISLMMFDISLFI